MEQSTMDAGSTVSRRQLGRQLRQLREQAGVTVRATCEAMEWSGQKLWRIEKGSGPVRALDAKNLCELFGADRPTTEAMMTLARDTKAKGWWQAYGKAVPAWFDTYLGLEAAARRLRWYESELIPGLVQTRRYAELAVRATVPGTEAEQDLRVELRMRRQHLLTRRQPPPLVLELVIGEAALLRTPPDPAAMREQLQHLVDVGKLPHVTVRVLPLAAGFHPALEAGSRFALLSFPPGPAGDGEPPVVYSENLTGAWYGDADSDVRAYDTVWARLDGLALPEDESAKLITELRHR